MNDSRRLEICWGMSASLHVAALGAYILFKVQDKKNLMVLSEIEIIEPEILRQEKSPPVPRQEAPKNVMEFLKMALPKLKPQQVLKEVAQPVQKKELLKPIAEPEKIELKKGLEFSREAIKLDRAMSKTESSLAEMAGTSQKVERKNQALLADAPIQLEEVGRVAVKVPKADFDAPMELKRADAIARLQDQALPSFASSSEKRAASNLQEAPLELSKASPSKPVPSFNSAKAQESVLGYGKSTQIKEGNYVAAPKISDVASSIPSPKASGANLEAMEVSKKSVELSGPISSRKIVKFQLPEYPQWAKEQAVSADVILHFYVSPEGNVRERIRIRRTSGYAELDRRAIDALKLWTFEPLRDQAEDQWGYVTFRYISE